VWCNHIKAAEFEAGGCESVIVGLYPITVAGKWQLNPICRNQCIEVATHSQMVLQAYYWDDITLDPLKQAAWVAETIQKEGLPIKFVWADMEQWWLDWAAWANARAGKIPWSQVKAASGLAISGHMWAFCSTLASATHVADVPNAGSKPAWATGIYTNNGFVASWAPGMNAWLPGFKQWVAQYKKEPQQVTPMSWVQLAASWLPDYDIALAVGQLPGQVEGHQFTGDVCELPGSYDQYGRELPLDVSVFERKFIAGLKGGANPAAPTTSAPVVISTPTPATAPATQVVGMPDGGSTPSRATYPTYQVIPGVNPNVHKLASASSSVIGVIMAGTVVQIDTVANGYSHMQAMAGFPGGGWLYSSYLKKQG
jgi:hypothetical protein